MTKRAHLNKMKARELAAQQNGTAKQTTKTKPAIDNASDTSRDASTSEALSDSTTATSNTTPINLLDMSPIDRKILSQGSSIKIYSGTTPIIDIPRLLFTSTSTIADILLTRKSEVHLPDSTDIRSITHIIDYLKACTNKNKIPSLRSTRDFRRDISICRTARLLGMQFYIQHIEQFYKRSMMRNMPTSSEQILIETGAIDKNDFFVISLANCYAYQIRKRTINFEDTMSRLETNFPNIATAAHDANQDWENRYWSRKEQEGQRQQQSEEAAERRAKRKEQNKEYKALKEQQEEDRKKRQEQKEEGRRENERRAALLEKLKQRVCTLTVEDVQLREKLRGRGDPAFM